MYVCGCTQLNILVIYMIKLSLYDQNSVMSNLNAMKVVTALQQYVSV